MKSKELYNKDSDPLLVCRKSKILFVSAVSHNSSMEQIIIFSTFLFCIPYFLCSKTCKRLINLLFAINCPFCPLFLQCSLPLFIYVLPYYLLLSFYLNLQFFFALSWYFRTNYELLSQSFASRKLQAELPRYNQFKTQMSLYLNLCECCCNPSVLAKCISEVLKMVFWKVSWQ